MKKSQNAFGYGSDEFNGREGYLKTSKPDLSRVHFGELAHAFIGFISIFDKSYYDRRSVIKPGGRF